MTMNCASQKNSKQYTKDVFPSVQRKPLACLCPLSLALALRSTKMSLELSDLHSSSGFYIQLRDLSSPS